MHCVKTVKLNENKDYIAVLDGANMSMILADYVHFPGHTMLLLKHKKTEAHPNTKHSMDVSTFKCF